MRISPSAEFKSLAEVGPGELVHVSYASDTLLALTARIENQAEPALVYLKGPGNKTAPCYGIIPGHLKVVSLGTAFVIEIDPTAPIELRPRRYYETGGAMCLVGAQWQLNVYPEPGTGWHQPMHYVLTSGQLINPPRFDTYASFTKWRVLLDGHLGARAAERSPIFSLDITNQQDA